MTYPVLFAGGRAGMVRPTVYGLVDPREPERIRYVGQTLKPATRYSEHMQHEGTVRGRWIADLRRAKLAPTMIELEVCADQQSARVAERRWIRELQQVGQADMNDASHLSGKRRKAILSRLPTAAVPSP